MRVNASNDFFVRTTDERHKALVQEFVQRIYDRGDIFESVYAGLYCTRCEAFYTEDELVDGLCPQHGIPPEYVEEKNYFFRLSAYQEPLLRLYDERPEFVLPGFRYNEARSFIERGLEDISVSRASQRWGVPVPWDHVAGRLRLGRRAHQLLERARLRASGRGPPAASLARGAASARQGHPQVPLRHLACPAAGGGARRPEAALRPRVPADGRAQDVEVARQRDRPARPRSTCTGWIALRFYLFRVATFGQDGSISVDGVHERYERELGNDLGNLVSRTTAMIARYRDGRLRTAPGVGRARGGRRSHAGSSRSRGSTRSTSRGRSMRSGSPCGRSTVTSSRAPPGSSRRTTRGRRTSIACSTSSRTACGRSLSRSPPSCPRRRRASWPRSASPPSSPGTESPPGATGRGRGHRARRAALPAGGRPATAA